MADTWYYSDDGKPVGPYSFHEVQMMAASGKITPEHGLCEDGQTWQLANSVMGLEFGQAASHLGYQGLGATANVSQAVVDLFGQTSVWTRIVSVITGIGAALMIAAGAFMILAGMLMSRAGGLQMAVMGAVYIAMSALYAVPCIFLWRYASQCKSFSRLRHEGMLERAVRTQKSFWKYTAIMALVIIGLYLLVIVAAIGMAVLTKH